MGILPRVNQENIGSLPMEHPEVRRTFQGDRSEYGHQKLLPLRLHRRPRVREGVTRREGERVDGLGGGVGWGGAPTPTDSL